MSPSAAAEKPELARPSSAKTELTCLSDILSQEAGAIGVPSQMFHAQNSLFETSQAMTTMASPSTIRTFACKGGRITTISTRSPSPAASFQSQPSFLSHQSPPQPPPLQLHLLSVSWQSTAKAAPQPMVSPHKQPSAHLDSTCSSAPTPATTPRDRNASSHPAQAARGTQAVLLQVQAQLKAHRTVPDPLPPAGDLSDTASTTAHWQIDADSEHTATATATTPSTQHPESPQKPQPAPECDSAALADLPVSTCSHLHTHDHNCPPPAEKSPPRHSFQVDALPALPSRAPGPRLPATTIAHIHQACAASARLRQRPLRPPPPAAAPAQPTKLPTPRGARGCRDAAYVTHEPASGLTSFSMRIHGGPGRGCGASCRNSRQAREHRVSELFARPVSYAAARSTALKPRHDACPPGGHHM